MKVTDTRGEGAAYASAGGERKAIQIEEAIYPSQASVLDSLGRLKRMVAYDMDGNKLIDMEYEYATTSTGDQVTIAYDLVNNPGKVTPQGIIDIINS